MHFPILSRAIAPVLAISLTALLAGCGVSDPSSPRFVVANGRGVKITRGELDKTRNQLLAQRGLPVSQIPPDQISAIDQQVLQQMVMQALLLKEGNSIKLPKMDDKVNAEIEKLKAQAGGEQALKERLQKSDLTVDKLKEELLRQLRIQEILHTKVPDAAEPSPEVVTRFYNDNKDKFSQPAMVRVSHVLIQFPRDATPAVKAQKKTAADAARARVVKGEDFAKVAREVSQDPSSAVRGGDVGLFRQGQMVPAFEKTAFSTPLNAISPVFETPFGYHFLKVTETRPAGMTSLDQARPQIAAFLKNQQRSQAITAYLRKIETDSKVVYHLDHAPQTAAPAPSNRK